MQNIHHCSSVARSAAVVALAVVTLAGLPGTARADFQVRSPIVEYLEWELEHNGSVTFDKKASGLNHDQSYTFSLGYGLTPWWRAEIEGETEAPPGGKLSYTATTFENMFQLAPQGKYWADPGFFFEFSHSALRDAPNEIKFGPVVQKEGPTIATMSTLHTLNLFVSKELGHNRGDATGGHIAWQSRLGVHPLFEPGFEFYGDVEDIGAPGKLSDQQHRIGPMFAGAYNFAPYGKIKYEVGYLFGLTNATERGAVRWKLEYELVF